MIRSPADAGRKREVEGGEENKKGGARGLAEDLAFCRRQEEGPEYAQSGGQARIGKEAGIGDSASGGREARRSAQAHDRAESRSEALARDEGCSARPGAGDGESQEEDSAAPRGFVRFGAGFRSEAAAFSVGRSVRSARPGSEVVGGRAPRPQRGGDGRGDRRRGRRAGDRGSLRRRSHGDSRPTSASGRGRIRVVR